jgi:hypothetical protein
VDSDDDRPADCKRTPECRCTRCRAERIYLEALRHAQERMAKVTEKK